MESGLDITLGDRCSARAYSWAKKTFTLRESRLGGVVAGSDGGFSNIIDFNGSRIAIGSDGVGTKVEVAERVGIYDTLGFDLTPKP